MIQQIDMVVGQTPLCFWQTLKVWSLDFSTFLHVENERSTSDRNGGMVQQLWLRPAQKPGVKPLPKNYRQPVGPVSVSRVVSTFVFENVRTGRTRKLCGQGEMVIYTFNFQTMFDGWGLCLDYQYFIIIDKEFKDMNGTLKPARKLKSNYEMTTSAIQKNCAGLRLMTHDKDSKKEGLHERRAISGRGHVKFVLLADNNHAAFDIGFPETIPRLSRLFTRNNDLKPLGGGQTWGTIAVHRSLASFQG